MTAILLEDALVIALVLILGALAVYAIRAFSPIGLGLRQRRSHRASVDDTVRTCPVHGVQSSESLIRLDDGSVQCAKCLQQLLHANNDK
jgi:hypothetical protein